MITVEDALSRVLALAAPLPRIEEVPLTEAAGRVLARPLRARRTQPPFAASAMDGYALRGDELRPGARFRVIGAARAGQRFDGRVGPGEAVRIFTGAPMPEGADRVLIQEDAATEDDGAFIRVRENPDAARHVRPAGADFAEGDVFAPRRLSARDVALLAAMNVERAPVRARPRVALIPTGDELVEPGQTPGPDQIVSSNGYGLHAMLREAGADPFLTPIARDDPASLRAALEAAAEADMIVTLGGASVGEHDLVRAALLAAGAELSFHKIAMRPGKPLMAGRLGRATALGLPGNPVSAMVCGALFAVPAARALAGDPAPAPRRLTARLAHPLPANGPRAHYARARLIDGPDGPALEIFANQDSAVLSLLAAADCLAEIPANAPAMETGTNLKYIPL
ncbi:molybdopterin molybdotransferase MoeA [Oceanicella actignis]|uniref:Molybdopterin molybdenumtransferase n=1 Tax=Oceanicella actignis TaxID=1189325 RepID=A0A1M7RSI7_9RHOB|nr:gephyrin-like molybdotransferase Glp [Oceanicella actignis]SET05413.1 molybdopterin molybdochelatase [Oceanicella actignis]SHN49273.1 molybdopterin molybdotransferase [Oceanicella actignis]